MNLFSLGKKSKSVKREGNALIVSKESCPQNHACPSVRVCPVGALSQQGYDAPIVDQSACILCGKCVKFCPRNALYFE